MRLHWLQHDVPARCPLCGTEGAKRALLSTDSVLPGRPPLTLLRCPACGVAFLEDLTPPDYEIAVDGMLDYYVEQGAGIDLIVAPLLRLPPGMVRRCLEVGGSVGFALDFGRWAFGWEVLGVDPSPLAAAGAEVLGLPVRRTYFDAGLDLGPEPFDLAICSEVLEHLAEPHPLLAALHDRLSPEGILVLSTPNLALVRPGAEEQALARALSPGFHMMLYDRGALVRVLAAAGFAAVRVEESPETLRAFAARSPATLDRLLPADPLAAGELLRGYFAAGAARTASVPTASSFASGFAYRHFKECVNAGLYAEAEASRDRLEGVYRRRYGRDLLHPLRDAPAPQGKRSLPFNLPGALYFSGILELNGLGNPQKAVSAFAAAQTIGELLRETMPTGLRDGETEALLAQSRKHLPMALAMGTPDHAVREIEKLEAAPAGKSLPRALLDEARAQTFIRLVNAGAYAAAERLAPGVARRIEASAETGEHAMDAEGLDSLYCLGMLALNRGRPGEAAELFGRVRRLAGDAGENAQIHWLARLHEGLSLWRAGRAAAARVALSEVAGAPVPPPVAEAARTFLAAVRG